MKVSPSQIIQAGRLAILAATILTVCDVTAHADEYRLYRIVGSELELYRRLEFEPDTNRFVPYVDETTQLRDAGFFDIHPEDMADAARRPTSRGDGFLWDAPRSRWIGLDDEVGDTLVALSQDDAERRLVPLYEFEPIRDSYALLSPSDDPDVFFVTIGDWDMEGLPTIARIIFGDDAASPAVELWDMADRDPERMRAIYGTPFPNREYFASEGSTVSRDDQVFTLATNIAIWDFGVMPPVHVLNRANESSAYLFLAVSPEGGLVAAIDSSDGCTLNVWRTTEETPFLSVPLQESDWLSGGIAGPASSSHWCESTLAESQRLWR